MVNFSERTVTKHTLDRLNEESALTMLGYMPEELHLYIEAIEGYVDVEKLNVWTYTGKELNEQFDTDFQDDLNIFSVELKHLKNISQLAVKERFQYGFRWLDDIVNNNRREEA